MKKPIVLVSTLKAVIFFLGAEMAAHPSSMVVEQQISFPEEKLSDRLKKISENAPYAIFYSNDTKLVMVSALSSENKDVQSLLSKSLSGSGFTYRPVNSGGFMIVPNGIAQTGPISGKILDENGNPISGASVVATPGNYRTITAGDGSYSLSVPDGVYTITVTRSRFTELRITEVRVSGGKSTPITVNLAPKSLQEQQIKEVVVTAIRRQNSQVAVLSRQKNTAEISNGLSSEQITALPDKHVGEALKRISGVSTIDNKKVVVRGIAERYNVAQLDGVTLPSTDVQERDFDFNIIPSNLIDNIIVSKGYTPDMSFGFGGGLVQINTLALPDKNFVNITVGAKYQANSTGKNFLGYGRGKTDYIGFDDGIRQHFPDDIFVINTFNYSEHNLNDPRNTVTPDMIREQNKKIGNLSRFGTRRYKAMPGQNYSLSFGDVFKIGKREPSRLGFVTAISYRNEQAIEDIDHYERGSFWEAPQHYHFDSEKQLDENEAKNYKFTTTMSGLVNLGWESQNHKVQSRNLYSRVFDNSFFRIIGIGEDLSYDFFGTKQPAIREYDSPKFLDLLQNKLQGEHKFGKLIFNWVAARSKIVNDELDATEAYLEPNRFANVHLKPRSYEKPRYRFDDDYDSFYRYTLGRFGPGQLYVPALSRSRYLYDEVSRILEGSLSYEFNIGESKQMIKGGVNYLERHGNYKWNYLPFGVRKFGKLHATPIHEININYEDPEYDGFYFPDIYHNQRYEGKNTNLAYYGMADNRIGKWARIVWGMRVESYEYNQIYSQGSDPHTYIQPDDGTRPKRFFVDPVTGRIVSEKTDAEKDELKWRYLPSVSVTLTPVRNLNFRTSYSETVVRPGLIENSRFSRFNPKLGTEQFNEGGILSTQITHYDTKLEWFPKAGDVLSVGYFRKEFTNPVEIYKGIYDTSQKVKINLQNSKSAEVWGWEFDMRKNLGFIANHSKILNNLYISGNFTVQKSEVQARFFSSTNLGTDQYGDYYVIRNEYHLKEKRALFGQVPWLYNIGMQYSGERLDLNVAFNHTGDKLFATAARRNLVEYERARDQLDAQVSYKLLKNKKLQVRLNLSNLLNSPYHFYVNREDTYKLKDNFDPETDYWQDSIEWKYGFDEKYQFGYLQPHQDSKTVKERIGDRTTFLKRTGSSFSLSVSYNF